MSLASVISELEADAKTAVANVVGGAEKVAEQIGSVLLTDLEDFLRQISKIALDAVMTELPKAISGQEKFGNAVTNVVQTVEAAGKPILVQDAQQAVQTAVRAVQAAAAPTP